MDIVLGASLLITFLAGMVALFAPCCIGFLLPAYLGAIFRERKQVLGMTFVFALGILTVFLPIGTGVGAVGSLLNRWHDQFFFAGAMMLVVFGLLLLLGKNIMVHVPIPRVTAQGYSSVYVLGIFSGIGTSCCAPVFAGVATLSALSGSALGGAVLASVYVFGMVLPLFVIAWAWDRADVSKRFSVLQRTVSWGPGRFRFKTILAHIIAGAIFIIAGAVIFWLTASNKIMAPAGWQKTLSEEIVRGIERIAPWLFSLSNIIWSLFFIIIVAFFLYSILRFRNRKGEHVAALSMSDQTDEQKEVVHKDAQTPQAPPPTQSEPSSSYEHCPNCEAEDVHAESVSISARALKDLEKRLGQTQIIQSSFILVAFVLGWLLANLDGFELKKSSQSSIRQSASLSQTSTQGPVSGEITDDLVKAVLPPSGVRTGLRLENIGSRVVATGAIDAGKLEELYAQRGGFQDWQRNILSKASSEELVLTEENAPFFLNLFWAVGLANKNPILEEGQMQSFGGNLEQLASTAGWTLGSGKGMDHYSKHALISLNASQQELVKKVAENVYRPCCGNSTAFPDCNHGMALLGVLELAASQGFSEEKMYDLAFAFNSFWFPDQYVKIAQYLKGQGKEWSSVDAKEVLGREYSSSSGFARVNQALQSQSPTPGASQQLGGGGCGV